MTIRERQEREQKDREHPWRPMNTAKPDGTVCELLFDDMVGHYATDDLHYFLDHDGYWYQINPPKKIWWVPKPINWRPAYVKISPERRMLVKREYEKRTGYKSRKLDRELDKL